jgi:chemotaxis protein CheY-P-specific phosphatase CheC
MKKPDKQSKKTSVQERKQLKLTEKVLSKIENDAAHIAAKSFTKLISSKLTVRNVETKFYSHPHINTSLELAKNILFHYQAHDYIIEIKFTLEATSKTGTIVAYIPLDAAKELVDILLKKPIGTTKNFESIDNSALIETLNIIGNAYLTAITQMMNDNFICSPPSQIGSSSIDSVISSLTRTEPDNVYIYFKNVMQVTKLAIQISIFIVIPWEVE